MLVDFDKDVVIPEAPASSAGAENAAAPMSGLDAEPRRKGRWEDDVSALRREEKGSEREEEDEEGWEEETVWEVEKETLTGAEALGRWRS